MPTEVRRLRGFDGDQKANRFSHWIWRRYASSIWDDIRMGRVLPFETSGDGSDQEEKHVHPLQLDVIERVIQMRSRPDETVLTPFLGVGSEAFCAVRLGRKAVGAELKPSYFRQAVANLARAADDIPAPEQVSIFDLLDEGAPARLEPSLSLAEGEAA